MINSLGIFAKLVKTTFMNNFGTICAVNDYIENGDF